MIVHDDRTHSLPHARRSSGNDSLLREMFDAYKKSYEAVAKAHEAVAKALEESKKDKEQTVKFAEMALIAMDTALVAKNMDVLRLRGYFDRRGVFGKHGHECCMGMSVAWA